MKRMLRELLRKLAGFPLSAKRKVKWIALTTALLLAGWGIGMLLFFPASSLENHLENEVATQLRGNGSLDLEDLSLRLPLRLSARAATLRLKRLPATEIKATDLQISPLWLSLLSGNPGLAYDFKLFGGNTEGFLRRNGEIHLKLENLQLALPLREKSPLAIAGTIERGELSAQWPPRANSASRLNLTINDMRLTGLEAIGSKSGELKLGSLVLQGAGMGNAFKIDRLESRDGQLTATGNGNLLLTNPIEHSRINLAVTLKPTPELDPQLLELLGMFVKKDGAGNFPLHISGTLSRPQAQ